MICAGSGEHWDLHMSHQSLHMMLAERGRVGLEKRRDTALYPNYKLIHFLNWQKSLIAVYNHITMIVITHKEKTACGATELFRQIHVWLVTRVDLPVLIKWNPSAAYTLSILEPKVPQKR